MPNQTAEQIHKTSISRIVDTLTDADRRIPPITLPFIAANAATASILRQILACDPADHQSLMLELADRAEGRVPRAHPIPPAPIRRSH